MPRQSAAAVLAVVAIAASGCASATSAASMPLAASPTPYVTGASTRASSTLPGEAGGPAFGALQGMAGDVGGVTPNPGAQSPGALMDLSSWYLTLPTGQAGSPDTVKQPALSTYSSTWFQLDPAHDGIVFTSVAGGVTTAHSAYPRSELREMTNGTNASWSNRTGTHVMTVRQAVTALPTAKPELVTAQIHDTKSDVIEIRLEGSRLVAQYDDGKSEFPLDPAYVLGTVYDVSLVASNGRIDVFYNGQHSGGIDQSGDGWYFKTGSYLQSNTAHGDAADAMGQVVIFGLYVSHSS